MKTAVLIISNLFLLISAAPVDHEIETRSASEEDDKGALQALLTEMRDTLANVNKPPPITDPTTKPTGLQEPPQVQTTYVLNPLPFNPSPPAEAKPPQQASVPQINLYITGLPQQDKPAAAEPLKQAPLQQLVLANADPTIPAIQNPTQVLTLPYGSVLPQGTIMPVNIPSQTYPNMISPLQGSPFIGPHASPYFQPLNPLLGHQGYSPYPFYPPPMYRPNPYVPNYGIPNVAISPPIIFRERGQTVTSQG